MRAATGALPFTAFAGSMAGTPGKRGTGELRA